VSPTTHTLRLSEAPFPLQCGATLPNVEIAFNTYGELAPDASNAVIVLHALTGWPAVDEWWSGIIGEEKPLDPSEYFIICPNLLGSCNGSTGPESLDPKSGQPYRASFPQVTIRDIARANLCLLDNLGIREVQLAIGGSMGGMVVLEMAALAPNRFKAIVPIAVTGSHSAWRIAFSSAIRKTIIAHDPTLRDKAKLTEGMKLARQIAMTSYRCSTEFDMRFGRDRAGQKFEVENYLEHQGEKIAARFSPYSYLTLTRAMELYDLGEGRGSIKDVAKSIDVPALFVGISSDILYLPEEIEQFATLLPKGEYATLDADHGHDSFLVDAEALASIIKPFLNAKQSVAAGFSLRGGEESNGLDKIESSPTRSLKAAATL
jgi:homoserine O-acetyltransferase